VSTSRLLAAVVTLGAIGWCTAASAQGSLAPRFEPVDCERNLATPIAARLVCGTVRVPRDHARVDAGGFALSVTVVKSADQPSKLEPVALVSEWPTRGLLVLFALEQVLKQPVPHAAGRDFILVDARGTGKSEPTLCPQLPSQLLPITLAFAQGDAGVADRRRQAFFDCRDELMRQGIDLKDFGAAVTARDLDWVRRALAVERWNVYGFSQGTAAATAMAAMYPQTVRSLTLVAPVAPDPAPPRSSVFAATREALFAACAADANCARDYPDLSMTYREAVRQLDQQPVEMADQPAPAVRFSNGRIRITGAVLELAVYNLIRFPMNWESLPHFISEAAERRPESVALVETLASVAANILTVDALTVSVECRDRPHLHGPMPDGASIFDRLDLYDICPGWSSLVPPPVSSGEVRTLVLGRTSLPGGPPAAGKAVAERIGQSARLIDIPGISQDVRDNSPCMWRIAADFIADPATAPDTSCISTLPPFTFVPRGGRSSGGTRVGP
jgi:pimeloyl-ACP methyl ester carboxylesterase